MTKEKFINDFKERYNDFLAEYQELDNCLILECLDTITGWIEKFIKSVETTNYDMDLYRDAYRALGCFCHSIVDKKSKIASDIESETFDRIQDEITDDKEIKATLENEKIWLAFRARLFSISFQLMLVFSESDFIKEDVEYIEKMNIDENDERLRGICIDEILPKLNLDDDLPSNDLIDCSKRDFEKLEFLLGIKVLLVAL